MHFQFVIGGELELNWTWIGAELELLRGKNEERRERMKGNGDFCIGKPSSLFLYKKNDTKKGRRKPTFVPRAGLEPARLSASVFETDLSTDSNIWAESGCKGNSFFLILQINLQKFCG